MATPRFNLLPRRRNWLLLALLLALAGLTFIDTEDWKGRERTPAKVAIADVPPAVQAAVARESRSGTLLEIDRTTVAGQPAYAASLLVEGRQQVTRIAPDGKVIDRGAPTSAQEEDDDD